MSDKMVTIFVDGQAKAVDPSRSLLEACAEAGAKIPTLCYLKDVSANASCGVCVVEVEGAKSLVRIVRGAGQRRHEDKDIQSEGHARPEERGRAPARQPPGRLPGLRPQRKLRAAVDGGKAGHPQGAIPPDPEGARR